MKEDLTENGRKLEAEIPVALAKQVIRLEHLSRNLKMIGAMVALGNAAQITLLLSLFVFQYASSFIFIYSGATLVLIFLALFIRDFLVSRGNDIFQTISDSLEDGSYAKIFSTRQDQLGPDSEKYVERRSGEVVLGDVRIILRSFVTSTRIPMARDAKYPEIIILSFHVFCLVAIILIPR